MYSIIDEEQAIIENYRYPAVLGYLVKKLGKKGKQIGKTKIQKLVYLLTRENMVKFDYSMHYYGPYSSQVSDQLSLAESAGIIESRWREDKGFFLKVGSKEEPKYEHLLSEKDTREIDELVRRFGLFDTKELTIVTTYLFLRDSPDGPQNDLVEEIHKIKNYPPSDIVKTLRKAEINIQDDNSDIPEKRS
jgi:uncharacterized protein